MRRVPRLILKFVLTLAASGTASAGVQPIRNDAPLGHAAEVVVSGHVAAGVAEHTEQARAIDRRASDVGRDASAPAELWLSLQSGESESEVARVPVGDGCVDLLEAFPMLRETPPARAMLVQAFAGAMPDGAPLVLVPIWTPARYESALTALVRSALRERSTAPLDQLLRTSPASIDALDQQVVEVDGGEKVFTGYRMFLDRRVHVRTSLGDIEFAFRHDVAPNHCAAFLRLVEGGFYDGTPIHRLVAVGTHGFPVLLQMGDPSGTGRGGSGERLAYEDSILRQRKGVLSMARVPGDPDSASSQIIIALSDEEAASLDGAATPFAELTDGARVLDEFSLIPVGSRNPVDPASPKDRPLASLKIERAWTTPAPARGTERTPQSIPEETAAVER